MFYQIAIRRSNGNIVVIDAVVEGFAKYGSAILIAAGVYTENNKPIGIVARFEGVTTMEHDQRDGDYLVISKAVKNIIFDEVAKK